MSDNIINFVPEQDYIVLFLEDGEVQINEKYTTTEAAREFWKLVKDMAFDAWSNHKKGFESGANAAANSPALAKSSHEEAAQGAEND